MPTGLLVFDGKCQSGCTSVVQGPTGGYQALAPPSESVSDGDHFIGLWHCFSCFCTKEQIVPLLLSCGLSPGISSRFLSLWDNNFFGFCNVWICHSGAGL